MDYPRKGARVETLEDLRRLALEKRSVIYGRLDTRQPAGFVLHFQGSRLLQLFNSGMYVYIPRAMRQRKREMCRPFTIEDEKREMYNEEPQANTCGDCKRAVRGLSYIKDRVVCSKRTEESNGLVRVETDDQACESFVEDKPEVVARWEDGTKCGECRHLSGRLPTKDGKKTFGLCGKRHGQDVYELTTSKACESFVENKPTKKTRCT